MFTFLTISGQLILILAIFVFIYSLIAEKYSRNVETAKRVSLYHNRGDHFRSQITHTLFAREISRSPIPRPNSPLKSRKSGGTLYTYYMQTSRNEVIKLVLYGSRYTYAMYVFDTTNRKTRYIIKNE